MVTVRKGSAKNTYIETFPTNSQIGSGRFGWTNRFSIFDYKEYGEFPWEVPYQEIALPIILRKTYEILHAEGVKTCVIGVDDDGKFRVNLVRVPSHELPLEPTENPVGTNNRMVDLEVTFNFLLHGRSSLSGRLREGKEDYRQYGFAKVPQIWEEIPIIREGRVKFRYTTKFEKGGDRSLSDGEAKERSRLTDTQWLQAQDNSTIGALAVYRYGKKVGVPPADGKQEWAVDDKHDVVIGDLVGNNYDDRFIFRISESRWLSHYITVYGDMLNIPMDIRQEILLKALGYFANGHPLYQDVGKQTQRNLYEDNGWRKRMKEIPPPIPIEPVQQAIGDMYLSVAQVWNPDVDVKKLSGREVRPLEEVASELWVIEEVNRIGAKTGENLLQWEWKESTKVK